MTWRPRRRARLRSRALLGSGLVVLIAGVVTTGQGPGRAVSPVTDEVLASPSGNDWLAWRGTTRSQGFSPLTHINRETVAQLAIAWTHPMKPGWQEAAPLVHDGVMYLAHAGGTVDALDAATGALLWTYTPSVADEATLLQSGTLRGGTALYGQHLIVAVPDGRLVALDARTGKEAWSTPVAKQGSGHRFGAAPVVARGGRIVSALSNCSRFQEEKCAIFGHDAKTGAQLWRTETIPKPGTTGFESWGDLPYLYRSGVDMWMPGSYDPDLNLVYWSTAQAKPWARASRGTNGDALYSNSTLALDPATGRIVWYRQTLPGESHDLDEVFENVLVDAGSRRSLYKMGKISILWELDRRTGKILRATDLGLQDVLDLTPRTGAVAYRPEKLPKLDTPLDYCPAPLGGKNWPSMAYSPETRALYIPYLHTCATMTFLAVEQKEKGGGMGGGKMAFRPHPKSGGKVGVLVALDLDGRTLWEHRQRAPFVSATLATAGGLVFVADFDRYLHAFDVKTGKAVWQTRLETAGHGFPASYAVNGRQYIAFPVGAGTALDMFSPQLVPEITPPKAENGLVVFALPAR